MAAEVATDAVAVAGTFLVFAAYLSLTAHLAARNVLGDVPADRALWVGPAVAAVAVVGVGLLPAGIAPALTVPAAVAVDVAAFTRVYGIERRLGAYVTLIHAVVSVVLAVALGGTLLLVASGP